ncbi:ABC transporter ATP-binding protein [Rhizobium lusitanum]|uniref:ABC transporter ATP-binding protein n=1 Tax=Rhizobium lusitanum TaxID=293958 RepID=UPI0015730C1B|nr:ABC transporter ATP-binding protein [Rhizobium lusitanum]NTJ09281.1 ABC transporter ATP-binding protein [Rhizobium lusitanum]
MTQISVIEANKSFGPQHILRDINLHVDSGEFIVLLGSSGCGKSTLLNVIAGLEDLDTGRIIAGDQDVTNVDSSRRNMSMVFQSYALYPTMTVRRNLGFGLRVNKVPKAEIAKRVEWAANLLQLTPLLDRRPSQLSGGQRQRVAIGRALVRRSPVCLFDEPLSNLDAKLRTEMRLEIKKLHQELRSTIVYVTHDQIEAMTLATRVAVMKGGKIEQYATPDELYEKPETLFVAGFVGSPSMNLLSACIHIEDGEPMAIFGDRQLPIDAYPFRQPAVNGQEIVIGFRPEEVQLADDRTTLPTLFAPITFIEPMGADTLVWFSFGEQKFSVRLPSAKARGLSGEVRLAFNASSASIFSKESEQRL